MQLSPAFCAHNGVVFSLTGEKNVRIGMLNPDDTVLRTRIIKAYPEYKILFEQIDSDSFKLQLSRLFSEEPSRKRLVSDLDPVQTSGNKFSIDQIENDAPLINFLNSIFLEAVSRKASDIHIEFEELDARVRFRIDGLLVLVRTISLEKALAISARLKLLSNLNVMESRRPQDGRIDIVSGGFSLDARLSITPTIHGESIVLRLLNRTDRPLSLEDLGFSKSHLLELESILGLVSGLVLVTGPTGSGKTTTLSALLRRLNAQHLKIISIEDPVEYKIEGITQIQTNDDLDLGFDTLLRRVFRQDPDIIMIGEIRDVDTAELAVRAALTGHLVFATLHTSNALETISRLTNMGVPGYQIATVLRSIVCQRLLRRICTRCKGKGCPTCSNTGYSGRIVAAEIIPINPILADMISNNDKESQLRNAVQKMQISDLREDAKAKIALKITNKAELARELGGG